MLSSSAILVVQLLRGIVVNTAPSSAPSSAPSPVARIGKDGSRAVLHTIFSLVGESIFPRVTPFQPVQLKAKRLNGELNICETVP